MDSRIRVYWSRIDKEVRRGILISASITTSILIVAGIIKNIILGGIHELAVAPSSPPAQIIQAVKSKILAEGTLSLNQPGNGNIDVQVENIAFFNDGQWAVADLPPKSETDQQTTIIVQQKDGRYVIAVGPGTNFPRSALEQAGAPDELVNYLQGRDRVSG